MMASDGLHGETTLQSQVRPAECNKLQRTAAMGVWENYEFPQQKETTDKSDMGNIQMQVSKKEKKNKTKNIFIWCCVFFRCPHCFGSRIFILILLLYSATLFLKPSRKG